MVIRGDGLGPREQPPPSLLVAAFHENPIERSRGPSHAICAQQCPLLDDLDAAGILLRERVHGGELSFREVSEAVLKSPQRAQLTGAG
jgi:hypothetical protein